MRIEPNTPHWQVSLKAIEELGGKASVKQIEDYFKENFPDRNVNNIRPDVTMLTVNANSRVHYFGGKQTRRTDSGSPYDKLFRRNDKAYEFYDPSLHGVWEVAKEEDGTLIVRQLRDAVTSDRPDPPDTQPTGDTPAASDSAGNRFALEAHLRDYLAQNLHTVPALPAKLRLFTDDSGVPGVEYRTDVGIIDILARGDDNAWYVIELKLGRGPDAALGQTLRYMGWIKHQLAGDAPVYGVVIAAETSDKLRYAASMATGIFLMEYDLKVALRPARALVAGQPPTPQLHRT